MKTPALRYILDEKSFKTKLFDNNDAKIIMSLQAGVFFKHKFKMTVDCGVFKFLWLSVDWAVNFDSIF